MRKALGRKCRKCGSDDWRCTPKSSPKCAACARRHDRARGKTLSRKRTRKASWLRLRYGLTEQEWDQMLIAQAGRCAICSQPMTDPQVDHDHVDGAVRELLCKTCNLFLGHVNEDTTILANAIEYLDRHHPERNLPVDR